MHVRFFFFFSESWPRAKESASQTREARSAKRGKITPTGFPAEAESLSARRGYKQAALMHARGVGDGNGNGPENYSTYHIFFCLVFFLGDECAQLCDHGLPRMYWNASKS